MARLLASNDWPKRERESEHLVYAFVFSRPKWNGRDGIVNDSASTIR